MAILSPPLSCVRTGLTSAGRGEAAWPGPVWTPARRSGVSLGSLHLRCRHDIECHPAEERFSCRKAVIFDDFAYAVAVQRVHSPVAVDDMRARAQRVQRAERDRVEE